MGGDDLGDPVEASLVDSDRSGVIRIDQQESLNCGVEELVELGGLVLPSRFRIRLDRQLDEAIVIEPRDFEITGEYRHPDRDGVSR